MRVSGDIGCRPRRVWAVRAHGRRRPRSSTTPRSAPRRGGPTAGASPCSCATWPPSSSRSATTRCPRSTTSASSTTAPPSPPACGGGTTTSSCCPTACGGQWFGPDQLDGERRLGFPEPVPRIAVDGWERFAERAPGGAAWRRRRAAARRHPAVRRRAHHPADLPPRRLEVRQPRRRRATAARSCSTGPTRARGRSATSWPGTSPSTGPGCPVGHTKETTIDELRRGAATPRRRRPTAGSSASSGSACSARVVQFGWEKAYGDDDELGWWCAAAADGLELL